jgi:hypothetical protein
MEDLKSSTERPIQKIVKIVRINPDNIRSVPVNDLLIGHNEEEFFLTFSSFEPPVILDKEDFARINETQAITRVKLVVTPKFAGKIAKVLSKNIERFNKKA